MAKLPSNTFMFNYNAKQYDSSTYTFPKAKGQLFDEDLVLNRAPNSFTDDYVYLGNSGAYMGKAYSSTSENPFNRSSSLGNSFTFVCKTSGFTGNMTNIFANRGSNYNYMVRGNIFHSSSPTYLTLNPPAHPQICVVRINSDGTAIRKFVDGEGNTLSSVSASSVSWGSMSNGVGFFAGYTNGNELFTHYFYWMYCSMEALTDEEILQVIKYNEGDLIPFGPDTERLTFSANGGTQSVGLTSENPWTASTTDTWIGISQTTGEGDATISITTPYNGFGNRTGTVLFTDSDSNTAELTVIQSENTYLPIMKLYHNGWRMN